MEGEGMEGMEWWHPSPRMPSIEENASRRRISGEGGPDDDGVTVTMIVREARYKFFGHEIGR
jgi:hypothetical protein